MNIKIIPILFALLILSSCQNTIESITSLNDYPHWHERMELFVNEKDSIKEESYIFLGNSITEGFDLKTYFPDQHTVNRGIVSDHIDGVIKRLDVCLGDVENAKLFILLGINDIGAKRSEKEIKYLYREMIKQISDNYDYDVYIHSILPTSPRWKNCPPQMIRDINTYIEKLAKRNGMTYVNIYPFFKDRGSDYANNDLFKDGLHPNENGYRIWANHLRSVIKQ